MKKIALYSSLLMLSACSTLADGQTNLTTVKTPGATNARCILENKDMKYVAYTDQTVRLMKSPHNLVVRCLAPGNREKTVLVKRELNAWVLANVTNGFVPGATYDYFSRGGFDYPDVITVDFSDELVKQYDGPKYMSEDLANGNHKGKLPYNGPTTVVTERDKNYVAKPLQKKSDFSNAGASSYLSSSEPQSLTPSGYYDTTPYNARRPMVSYDPLEEEK